MTVGWTAEQVIALAPDAGSVKRGKSLAIASKWPLLGHSNGAVWGECKGSGKKPYRTQIDLSDAAPAFRCSCPSRKFPCKHAIGLFLLLTDQAETFGTDPPPDWVTEWLAKRTQTAEKKKEKQKKAADPVAQAKRTEQRATKTTAGLDDLSQWLDDIIHQGLAALPNKPYGFWDQMAARLVDAQAPGMAGRVRRLASIPHSGPGWPERMLKDLGKIQLLIQGYGRIDTLPPDLQAEVRSHLGWPLKQDDLRQRSAQSDPLVPSAKDSWHVLGQVITEEENLKMQRVWLWGEQSQQFALVLSFAHGRQPLDTSLVPGKRFDGTLIFYPGTSVRRAFLDSPEESRPEVSSSLPTVPAQSISEGIGQYADALGKNPWLDRFPMMLTDVIPRYDQSSWWLIDSPSAHSPNEAQRLAQGQMAIPLDRSFSMGRVSRGRLSNGWQLFSISGGHPVTLFGEWTGMAFLPLGLWTQEQFFVL